MNESLLSVKNASGRQVSLLNAPAQDTKRKYHCTEPGCNKSFTTRQVAHDYHGNRELTLYKNKVGIWLDTIEFTRVKRISLVYFLVVSQDFHVKTI